MFLLFQGCLLSGILSVTWAPVNPLFLSNYVSFAVYTLPDKISNGNLSLAYNKEFWDSGLGVMNTLKQHPTRDRWKDCLETLKSCWKRKPFPSFVVAFVCLFLPLWRTVENVIQEVRRWLINNSYANFFKSLLLGDLKGIAFGENFIVFIQKKNKHLLRIFKLGFVKGQTMFDFIWSKLNEVLTFSQILYHRLLTLLVTFSQLNS